MGARLIDQGKEIELGSMAGCPANLGVEWMVAFTSSLVDLHFEVDRELANVDTHVIPVLAWVEPTRGRIAPSCVNRSRDSLAEACCDGANRDC